MYLYEVQLVRNQTGKVYIEANDEDHADQIISGGQYTEPEWNDTDFYIDTVTQQIPF